MKTSIFSLAAALLASAVTATPTADASPATTTCLADYIVQTCLETENSKLALCATTDYACQCAAYQAIVTCYNNCPDDPAQATMEGQVTVFCGLASQYASSTTSAAAKTGGSSSAAGALQTASATSTSAVGTATGTSASATATETANSNSGPELALNAGGLLVAVAGVVAAVL